MRIKMDCGCIRTGTNSKGENLDEVDESFQNEIAKKQNKGRCES
ncbi:Uncharacterized protein APZ42_025917 [Daphnia magna]|uniref:Uncharacterized protein n=1 Tax=Daphnia magna TaxID=35525 RepID=A0A164SMX3_9CRUS|nr:Uncharacterized protein APZ42_025917 [Daphnia magna]